MEPTVKLLQLHEPAAHPANCCATCRDALKVGDDVTLWEDGSVTHERCDVTLPPERLPRSPGADVIIVCPSCECHWTPEDGKCPNCGRGIDESVN